MGSRSTSTAVRRKVRGFAEGSSLKPWRARRCAASSSVRPGHRSSVGSSVLGGVALSRNSERVTIIGCVSLEPGKAPGWWSDERWKTTNAHRASPLLISFEGAPGGSDCGHTASRMVLEIYDADGGGRVSLGRLRSELLLATRHSSRDSRSQVVVQFALILLVGQFFKTDPVPEFK